MPTSLALQPLASRGLSRTWDHSRSRSVCTCLRAAHPHEHRFDEMSRSIRPDVHFGGGFKHEPHSSVRSKPVSWVQKVFASEMSPHTNPAKAFGGLTSGSTAEYKATEPFRKGLKDKAQSARQAGANMRSTSQTSPGQVVLTQRDIDQWELTVGIEIHAQLNTDHKLFSTALSATEEKPNTLTAPFDLSYPGSQPIFQPEVLVPAIRAATALQCKVNQRSKFDRKHYFYHDQPAGYQITQYYEPFAVGGQLKLFAADGIADEDGQGTTIGIKQIQLEQDTAKTIQQPPDNVLLDFNRVGHPLIEIISLPHIHHPKTASAFVRKVSQLLLSINAVTTGLELGGLRADVNVSVKLRSSKPGHHTYAGVSGLGQRTEIKNLSSFKAIEEAIIAERNRQIIILQRGQEVKGETRGWTLGSTETVRLRGKEGEVDYRYMPDPDIPPLHIGSDLIAHIQDTQPSLPSEQYEDLTVRCRLKSMDAVTLVADASRLDYFHDVLDALSGGSMSSTSEDGKLTANWVLHELGGLFSSAQEPFDDKRIHPDEFGSILQQLRHGNITGKTAKQLLARLFDGDSRKVTQIIAEDNLAVQILSEDSYRQAAAAIVAEHADVAEKIRAGQKGKLQFLVGQMMRKSGGRMDPQNALRAVQSVVEGTDEAQQ